MQLASETTCIARRVQTRQVEIEELRVKVAVGPVLYIRFKHSISERVPSEGTRLCAT